MNVIMRVIKAWLSEHRTDLLSWTEDGQFKKMMSAVEACYSESDAPLFWRQQGEFLETAEGARYWDELIAEQDKLWGEMEAFRWQLVEVGDQADEACTPLEA